MQINLECPPRPVSADGRVHRGEDDNLWECFWITSGERHSGYSRYLDEAINQSLALGTQQRREP